MHCSQLLGGFSGGVGDGEPILICFSPVHSVGSGPSWTEGTPACLLLSELGTAQDVMTAWELF